MHASDFYKISRWSVSFHGRYCAHCTLAFSEARPLVCAQTNKQEYFLIFANYYSFDTLHTPRCFRRFPSPECQRRADHLLETCYTSDLASRPVRNVSCSVDHALLDLFTSQFSHNLSKCNIICDEILCHLIRSKVSIFKLRCVPITFIVLVI